MYVTTKPLVETWLRDGSISHVLVRRHGTTGDGSFNRAKKALRVLEGHFCCGPEFIQVWAKELKMLDPIAEIVR